MIGALITAFAPAIIRGAEWVFREKPKSGLEKSGMAVAALRAISQNAVETGLAKERPTDDALRGMVEAFFQEMQKDGKIDTAPLQQQTPSRNATTGSPVERTFIVRGTVYECPPLP